MDELINRTEERVEAVNARESRAFYKKRVAIHPKLVFGRYRQIKWAAMAVLLAVYYLLPWVRYDRGPSAPGQAVLIDVPARKFYFFFIEIWPQEVYYWTGLLIVAAVGLFFVSSLFGRVWCGYACPQTVWTDLFIYIERLIEGDRNARIRLAAARWTPLKIGRKALKHALWIAIGLATGGAWVFYFADAPTLLTQLVAGEAPLAAYLTIAILTGTTYVFAGLAREQICTYVCPYARFQSAMFDEDTMLVTYQAARGEPRGKHKKGEPWEDRGHCIDCNQCVAVCPMGIDIRQGQQMECITCALCIDACNGVMDKIGLPRGLIRYDTLRNMQARAAGQAPHVRLVRVRTLVYAGTLMAAAAAILISLFSRADLDITVQRDRNPVYVTLSNGDIRNGYTIKVLNKAHDVRSLVLAAEDLPGARLEVQGHDVLELRIGPDQIESFRVFVRVPSKALGETSTSFEFVLTEPSSGARAEHGAAFVGPKR
jgi:cytochrome c oxidase accessory protein FixG